MGILQRLFGARSPQPVWRVSENGNPTMVHNGVRFTIFQQDRGWKYVMADEDDEHDPFFSDRYPTEDAAKAAVLDLIRSNP